MLQSFYGFAKPKQFLELSNKKGIVPHSSDSNAVSGCSKLTGGYALFFNFFKFFNNATTIKKFIKRCKDYIFGNVSYTKRSIAYLTRILKCTRFQVVQNSNQTKQSFNVIQRQYQPLSLWFGQRFVYSVQCFTSQGYQCNRIIISPHFYL